MTTDTVKKEMAVTFEIGGKTVTIGAIAKGSGMIHPNMGTMLCFVTTDCAITQELLHDGAAARSCTKYLQPHHRGRRHLHQRYLRASWPTVWRATPLITGQGDGLRRLLWKP